MDSTSRKTDPPGREQPKAPPERSSRQRFGDILPSGVRPRAIPAVCAGNSPPCENCCSSATPAPDSRWRPGMGAGVLRRGEEAYAAPSSRALSRAQCTWKASVPGLGPQACAAAHRRSPRPAGAMRQRPPARRDEYAANVPSCGLLLPLKAPRPGPHTCFQLYSHIYSRYSMNRRIPL